MKKIGVKILPRPEVLDSQGRAVSKTLSHHNYSIEECRVGKYVELKFDGASESEALEKAKQMAELVLHNPLVENYELEVL